jgi:hypothetical protein
VSNQAAIKLHRRVLRLDDANWTVLSLRPGDPVVFATNRFHETWHIVGGLDAAALLARLFWALAFQRHERTFILIDRPFLVPNPNDSDPSSPIVLANSNLGTPRRHALDALHSLVPLTSPSLGTVKLRTVGLDRALEDPAAYEDRPEQRAARFNPQQWREWMDRVHGLIVYAAPDAVLRQQAVMIAELPSYVRGGSAATDLADQGWQPGGREVQGEVQVFAESIIERSARLRELREQRFPGRSNVELSDDEREELWRLGASE